MAVDMVSLADRQGKFCMRNSTCVQSVWKINIKIQQNFKNVCSWHRSVMEEPNVLKTVITWDGILIFQYDSKTRYQSILLENFPITEDEKTRMEKLELKVMLLSFSTS